MLGINGTRESGQDVREENGTFNSLASVLITIHQTLPHTDLFPFQIE